MKILVLSEIKYNSIKTRKQQLISRFPKDWEILFLEPYKAGRENNFRPKQLDNIQVCTVPFLKNFKGVLKKVFSSAVVRIVFFLLSALWIKLILRFTGFKTPNTVVISNLYAMPYLHFECPMIYDMNDDHLAFENTPEWLGAFRGIVYTVVSKIVVCSESLIELVPEIFHKKVVYIGNGVDVSAFIKPTNSSALMSQELAQANVE